MAHVVPRVPANENDVFLPMRDASTMLETIVRLSGQIERIREIPMSMQADENISKINELVRCVNTLVDVVSGRN